MNYIFEYIITFALAFIVAFSATPIAKRIAFKVGAIDIPTDKRRMHKKPIALLGGLAIITGFTVAILFNLIPTIKLFTLSKNLVGLFVGIIIIIIMGVFDDTKNLNSKAKLLFQIVAAIAVVYISGTRIMTLTNPFASHGYSILSPYISYPLTILWIVGITNAINLIDGLDGLAAGVAIISAFSLFFVSMMSSGLNSALSVYTAIITISLAGSTLGFLPYNFNPAKIFMGETGSAFLGFTLAVISIQGTLKAYTAIAVTVPLLVLGIPVFDTLFAILRRLVRRKSIMQADRGHIHHRLIDMGLSQKQSVIVIYTASASLGLCAIVLANRGALSALILLILVSVFIIGGAKYMRSIGDDSVEDTNKEKIKEE